MQIGIFRRFIEVEKIKIEKNTVQETLIIPLYGRKMCSEKFSCKLLQSGEHASIVVTYRYIQHGFVPSKLHSPFRYIFCILPQGAIFSSIT